MKIKLMTVLAAASCTLFAFNANANSKTNEALNMCKAHVATSFAEADRRKVTKIKTRRSTVEVKFAIREGEQSFKGVCLVDNGELSFSSDRPDVAAS